MATNDREIERKYLLRGVPVRAAVAAFLEIDQGYLPGARIHERVRRTVSSDDARFYRTIKMGSGIERFELEEETDELFFTTVWPLTRGRRVAKRRYKVAVGDLVWEIDDFRDRALVLAEVELERANQVVDVPEWLQAELVREVTDDPTFTNFNLSK